jgi:hypothetical protein
MVFCFNQLFFNIYPSCFITAFFVKNCQISSRTKGLGFGVKFSTFVDSENKLN